MKFYDAMLATIPREHAIIEIEKHNADVNEFFKEVGYKDNYKGGEILTWLGYQKGNTMNHHLTTAIIILSLIAAFHIDHNAFTTCSTHQQPQACLQAHGLNQGVITMSNQNQQIIENDVVYKKVLADSFGGVMYNIDNHYDGDHLVKLWDHMTATQQSVAGGIMKGAIAHLKDQTS